MSADIIAEQVADAARREAFGAAWTDYTDDEGTTTEIRSLGEGLELMRAAAEKRRRVGYHDLISRIENPTFEDTVRDVLDEAFDLIVSRQRTYGASNIEQQGVLGIVNRITLDKAARIRQRLNGKIVSGEVVLDDIELGSVDEPGIINDAFDFIGYGVCLILLLRGEWGRPLADET